MKTKISSYARVISRLSKFQLSGLVTSTAGLGFLAGGSPIEAIPLASVMVGTFLTACSASTFNQIIEVKSDALMKRTRLRPLPTNTITSFQAKTFGAVSGSLGIGCLIIGNNPITGALGLANLLLYTQIYTPLKKKTIFNSEIGAIVGAIPPIMGWTAATGSFLAPETAVLGSILFLWQMPHFLSLAWLLRKDYAIGGYRMRSLNDVSGKSTSLTSLIYTACLFPLPIFTTYIGMTSAMFAIHGLLANGFIASKAWQFYSNTSDDTARSLFHTSLWQLPLLMSLFAYNKIDIDEKNAIAEFDGLHSFGRRLCLHESLIATTSGKDLCMNCLDTTGSPSTQYSIINTESNT
uniref:Heme O synthase n=1 Tax=Spongospora subterranea TaxID=70186 RepID=A0A0H5R9X2_9EUKA|eukprot:CRZ10586.1 hypothetical protein [Spongospora subterranea]